jgi:hypothetical protein
MAIRFKDQIYNPLKSEKKALKAGIFSDRTSFFLKEKKGIYLDTNV